MNKEKDVLFILGDHLYMGEPEFLSNIPNRTMYATFSGTPPIPDSKRRQKISPLDMAPSLLEAAGGTWGSDQFGLGISLFSQRPSLLEQYGLAHYNAILGGSPLFYARFY